MTMLPITKAITPTCNKFNRNVDISFDLTILNNSNIISMLDIHILSYSTHSLAAKVLYFN